MEATDPQPYRSLDLVNAVSDAYLASDWKALRALYHDDALLSTLAAQQQIVPPDELVEIFARVTTETIYEVNASETIPIDDQAVLVTGRIRYPVASGGFGEGQRAWMLTFKDGLLYRTCAFTSAARARAAYMQYGVDLGIESAVRQGSELQQLEPGSEATSAAHPA